VDPYSLAVFSSNGTTVARLQNLRIEHGLSMEDALDELVLSGQVI